MQLLHPNDFPPLLSEIPDAPRQLYVEGTLPDDNKYKMLCVVGSRKYSPYGKAVCEQLIEGMRGHPVVIVSGLALGIDGIAHRAALNAHLTTIAVPGSGLSPDVLYPSAHRPLAREILAAGGALVSEFEPDFRPATWSFPQRNRIMAGMSHAILVIEAVAKSGTLITARLAADYNRDVLAVPGSIFSESSTGPHLLLKLGAVPIISSADILDALGFVPEPTSSNKLHRLLSDASAEERHVLEILAEPRSRDDLIRMIGKQMHETNTLLTTMEIKGMITEEMGVVRVSL